MYSVIIYSVMYLNKSKYLDVILFLQLSIKEKWYGVKT